MKRIITLAVALVTVFQLSAQKWVSTSAQNKNVVLEEFTGIHCGYCPDGHKRATEIDNANPDRVVLINIHAGGYAQPGIGEPDFRTTAGEAIDDAAGVTGYPSGSVNRRKTPWGQSRSTWASDAATVLTESSPVNVYVKGYVDLKTRELVTEVEIYYTANSNKSTNYLTVGLLQNNVLGPQSDYGNYNPTNWIGDQYIHRHILRMLMTATMGDKIDTTTSAHYEYRKYVTTLPNDIKGVELALNNLEVFAFVSEANAPIYSGVSALVDYDHSLTTDLSLKNITAAPTDFCFTSINPKVEIINNSENTITTFDVFATVDGIEHKKSFSGVLAKGQTTTIDWGTINFSARGDYSIALSGFKNISNGLIDVDITNNNVYINGIGFTDKAVTTFSEDFESGKNQLNSAFDLSQNPKVVIRRGTSTKYGALNTSAAALFYLHSSWGMSGKPASIVFGEVDLTQVPDPVLTYYYAYQDGGYGGTAPHVTVEVSENCGQTWTSVSDITLTETGTPPQTGYLYNPLSSDYIWIATSLADYKDKEVLVKISGIPGTNGNSMYIDEINLSTATGIADVSDAIVNVSLYPNPVEDYAYLNFELAGTQPVSLDVYNTLGEKVMAQDIGVTTGIKTIKLDLSEFTSGAYVAKLMVGDNSYIRKFIVK